MGSPDRRDQLHEVAPQLLLCGWSTSRYCCTATPSSHPGICMQLTFHACFNQSCLIRLLQALPVI